MTARKITPRLHVLLASKSPLAVVIRRGPSKRVCTVLWDRSHDSFSVGQWLKGRIYERRSDLSPDGKHLIYFAMNGKWKSEAKGSWTAISRAPYLKAIVMLPKGDCWNGGGLFTGKAKYWLNEGYGHESLQTSTEVQRDTTFAPTQNFGGECPGIYYPRLMRDGWNYLERRPVAHWHEVDVFEKPTGKGWLIRKLAHGQIGAEPGKGCYWDEHELVHEKSEQILKCPDWEWADLDGKRLVWCAGGKLHTGRFDKTGLGDITELYDYSQLSFSPRVAPY